MRNRQTKVLARLLAGSARMTDGDGRREPRLLQQLIVTLGQRIMPIKDITN